MHLPRSGLAAFVLLVGLTGTASPQDSLYRAKHEEPNGRQILAIYIGSTDCQPCIWAPFKASLKQMWSLLQAQANRSHAGFGTLGVAINDDADSGAAMLAPLSQFDEVSLGGGWVNHLAVRYIWTDSAGVPAIPQVLVIARDVNSSEGKTQWSVTNSRVLTRVVGADLIRAWIVKGAPLPGQSPARTGTPPP
jgi:hypothetical protein